MAEGVTEAERQGRREGPHCVVGHGVDLALLYWGGGGADNAAAVVRAHQEGRRREGRTTGHVELFGVDGPTYCAATFSSKSALARGALPHTPHSPCGRKGRYPNRFAVALRAGLRPFQGGSVWRAGGKGKGYRPAPSSPPLPSRVAM